jgi:hypothetical protein
VARKLRGSETASTKKVLFRIQYLTCGKLRVQFDARFTAYPAAWNPFGPRQEGSMKQSEKRSNVRCLLQIPVRFRCFEIACANLEIPGQTINISRSGLFLISAQRLKVGSSLSLTLRVPTEISGSAFNELRCTGRVVHEQKLKNGTMGYGVEIERMALPVRQSLLKDSNLGSATL